MKVLFLTGSRSDWGYIKPIIDECKKKNIKNHLCVTNMLLLDTFGSGVKNIVNEGYKVDEEIFMSLDGYNSTTTSKSIGLNGSVQAFPGFQGVRLLTLRDSLRVLQIACFSLFRFFVFSKNFGQTPRILAGGGFAPPDPPP